MRFARLITLRAPADNSLNNTLKLSSSQSATLTGGFRCARLISTAEKLPLPEAKFKRTLGKSLPYSEGCVFDHLKCPLLFRSYTPHRRQHSEHLSRRSIAPPPISLSSSRFVHKPEMEGKDSSNRIREVVEILAKGEHDAGLENPQDCGAQWNTGVMYWRATPRAIKLLDYAKEVMAADPMHPNEPMKRDDQKPINAALRVSSEACPWSEETKGPTVRGLIRARLPESITGRRITQSTEP